MPAKTSRKDTDELRPEYDFERMSGRVRGKYLERALAGSNIVVLDDDVVQAFPTQEAVNQALRLLAELARSATASEGGGKGGALSPPGRGKG